MIVLIFTALLKLTSELSIDGHRADIVILKTAIAQAAYDGRTAITAADILTAAELALPHRLQRDPFSDAEIQVQDLEDRLRKARQFISEPSTRTSSEGSGRGQKKTI